MTEQEVKDYIQGLLDEGTEGSRVVDTGFSEKSSTFSVEIQGYVPLPILNTIAQKFQDENIWVDVSDENISLSICPYPQTIKDIAL